MATFDISHARSLCSARCSQRCSMSFLTLSTHSQVNLPCPKTSLSQCPPLLFSQRRACPASLNPLPFPPITSVTALNPLVWIVGLSPLLAFLVARDNALVFLEATTPTMESSTIVHEGKTKKGLVIRLAATTASAGQTRRLYAPKAWRSRAEQHVQGKCFPREPRAWFWQLLSHLQYGVLGDLLCSQHRHSYVGTGDWPRTQQHQGTSHHTQRGGTTCCAWHSIPLFIPHHYNSYLLATSATPTWSAEAAVSPTTPCPQMHREDPTRRWHSQSH